MKTSWSIKYLGDICKIIGGGTPSKRNTSFYQGAIPWATVRDMGYPILDKTEFCISEEAVENSATNVIPKGNVIIASRVGLGKTCILKNDTAINQDIRAVIPKKKNLLPKYLYWWFCSIAAYILSQGKGATVKGVTLPFLKSLPIPVPPLSEQERIVWILDAAFEKIDKIQRNAERNLANAKELFLQILDEEMSRFSSFLHLKDVCSISTGKLNANAAVPGGKYPFFTCSREIYQIDSYSFDCEALLLAGNNASGDFNVKYYKGKFDAYQRTYVIHGFHDYSSELLFHILQYNLSMLKALSLGVNTRFLKIGMIESIKLPNIPTEQQIQLAKRISNIYILCRNYNRKALATRANCLKLKQSFLTKAFNGDL